MIDGQGETTIRPSPARISTVTSKGSFKSDLEHLDSAANKQINDKQHQVKWKCFEPTFYPIIFFNDFCSSDQVNQNIQASRLDSHIVADVNT